VRLRRATAAFSVWCAGLAGCGKVASPPCPSLMAVEALCEVNPCDLTWDVVQTDHAYCGACQANAWRAGSCGRYDVLVYADPRGDFNGESRYYDKASGDLAGAVIRTPSGNVCLGAPGVTFVDPDCSAAANDQLPGWCSPAGGADAGARAFPCCAQPVVDCSQLFCPMTWRDSKQAAFARYCQPLTEANPQAGVCGDYDVLRYQEGTIERTFYYDATGALVAEIASDSTCEYGPTDGLELPICSSTTLSPICAAGSDAAAAADGP
jgi:hypothetical protein